MMRIFVRNLQGNTTTILNVKSCETIRSIKRKVTEKEGIRCYLHVGLIYNGKFLKDEYCTLAQCEILEESTLHLFLSQHALVEPLYLPLCLPLCLLVNTWSGKNFYLNVMNTDTIDAVKVKIQEKEGIPPHKQLLFLRDEWLEDGSLTLADYHVWLSLNLAIQIEQGTREGPQPNIASEEASAPPQYKRPRPATQTTPTMAAPAVKDPMPGSGARPSVLTELEATELTKKNKELSSRCANYESKVVVIEAENKRIKEELTVLTQKIKDLSSQRANYENKVVDMEAENRRTKEELTVLRDRNEKLSARCVYYESKFVVIEAVNKRAKEESTMLTQKNKELSSWCANYESKVVDMEAENKRIKEEPTVLTHKNNELSSQRGNYKSKVVDMEAENKRIKEELMVLTHKNKVFSARCASYESQVFALEVENKKIKDELMNSERKYYSGARAAGYAEGLKEGKKKWLKSVDFLHHLTDASMKYFNYGFNSCQKQAEQQGFVGQLNKDTALKDAPELKISESDDQPE